MKKYKVNFHGRKSGALGICYPITVELEHETGDPEEIRVKLYDEYERVTIRSITEIV